MAKNDLIIDDEYCESLGRYFVECGNRVDDGVKKYIEVLNDVKAKGIVSGDVSKALAVYITYVNKLNKQVGNISRNTEKQIKSFLNAVDREDKYLF